MNQNYDYVTVQKQVLLVFYTWRQISPGDKNSREKDKPLLQGYLIFY